MTLNSSIFAGSPAEKADLEVADEILEVNGESLENSNHTDVIAHIHNVRMSLPLKAFSLLELFFQSLFRLDSLQWTR